jgi:hypothetical protein
MGWTPWNGQEGIEEPGLRAAGIGEGVADALRHQLVDQELPARPEYTLLLHCLLLVSCRFGSRPSEGSSLIPCRAQPRNGHSVGTVLP